MLGPLRYSYTAVKERIVEMIACCSVLLVAWLTFKLTTSNVVRKIVLWIGQIRK